MFPLFLWESAGATGRQVGEATYLICREYVL